MITFLQLGQYGRLGNQLFQYAALKSLSLCRGYEIKLPRNIYETSWHSQKCLLSNFNLKFSDLENNDLYQLKTYDQYSLTGSGQAFDRNFFNLEDNTNLIGFFQNLKYFEEYSESVKEDFKIKSSIVEQSEKYLRDKFSLKRPVVSIHVRRGDYSDAQFSNQQLIQAYIEKCISYFNDEVDFLLFTGGSREPGENNINDVEYLKDNYRRTNFYYSETNNPMIDFSLMTMCNHNIISHDSTFSWWAAYLNDTKDRKVFAPKNPRSLDQTIEYDNFYPDDWILL
jgi:hypothetical protein